MDLRKLSTEHLLYLAALALAVFARLVNLETAPLSDFEASAALQAWQVAVEPDVSLPLSANPGYILLTALLFKVFGSSNLLARLLPVLAGSALVLAPWFFRNRLGRLPAVVLAFGLALDPGLVSQSRLAGGPLPALALTLLALALVQPPEPSRLRWAAAGALAGLALLSGPAVFHGVVILGLSAGLAAVLRITSHQDDERGAGRSGGVFALAAMAASVLLGGTLLFLHPAGLSAWLGALPEYLAGWLPAPAGSAPVGDPALRVPVLLQLLILASYQPLALVFGLVGLVRRSLNSLIGLWLAAALLIVLLYPARQVGDLIWVLVPLWALAAQVVAQTLAEIFPLSTPFSVSESGAASANAAAREGEAGEFELARQGKFALTGIALSQAVLVAVLFGLLWLNLAGLAKTLIDAQAAMLRYGVMAGVLLLAGLTTMLVGLGWSWQQARLGAKLGLLVSLGIYTFAGLTGATLLRSGAVHFSPDERWSVWQPAPGVGDTDLLRQTVEQLSLWGTGDRRAADILVTVDSPALRWALRDFPAARFTGTQALASGGAPAVVVTRQGEENPSLASSYRGQDFVWWSYPDLLGALPGEMAPWFAYRSLPWRAEKVILWARADLFPGGLPGEADLVSPEDLPVEDGQLEELPLPPDAQEEQ